MNKWLKPDPDFKKYLQSAKPRLVDKLTPDTTISFDKCDIPDESDFISIPNSNRKIMKGYLSLNGETIVNTNYVQFHDLIKEMNLVTKKQFRMPYFAEAVNTYYNSKNEDFKKTFQNKAEWLDEIVSIDEQWIMRSPANARFVEDEFKYDGTKEKMKIAKEDGYFKKVNAYGYPETIQSDKPKNNPLYLWQNNNTNPVLRCWASAGGCPDASVNRAASLSASDLSARLVS